MKRVFFLIAMLPLMAHCQSIINLNSNYRYDPLAEAGLDLKVLRQGKMMVAYYQLEPRQAGVTNYSISWEKRDYYAQRAGQAIASADSSKRMRGMLMFGIPEKPWLLVAKVKNNDTGNVLTFFALVDPKTPVNGYIENDSSVVMTTYVAAKHGYTFHGSGTGKPLHVAFYKESFPAGSPAFAERDANVDRFLFPDSTFRIDDGAHVTLSRVGLYLVQEDTTAVEGFAFRVVGENYPRYTRLQDLCDPLIFITTQEEHERLVAAREEKVKFDKVILEITGNKERAKDFMKSYFKRVELANHYFTSYKEGWRTDRGMIYMIFGLPDEISRNDNTEVWNYKGLQTRFTFVRAGSIYDPDYYTLLRDKRFTEKWYYTIDLWRKSRF